jgi:hypothetical protein
LQSIKRKFHLIIIRIRDIETLAFANNFIYINRKNKQWIYWTKTLPKKAHHINDKKWMVFEADREAYRSSSTLGNWDQLNVRHPHPIQYAIRWLFLNSLRDRFELILNESDHECNLNIESNIWWDCKRHNSGSTIFQDQLSKNILHLLVEDLLVPLKLYKDTTNHMMDTSQELKIFLWFNWMNE